MEKLQRVFVTPGLEVYHDVARGWLYTRWLGEHTNASIEQALDNVCGYLRGNAYTKILSDQSGLVGKWPPQSAQDMQRYFDSLAAQGITYFAWVYNESNHNRIMMEKTLHEIEHPAVAAFQDVASAYEWLCRCGATTVAKPSEQAGLEQYSAFS